MRYNLIFGTVVTITQVHLVSGGIWGPNAGERVVSDIRPEALTRKQNEVQSSLWDCCYCDTSAFNFRNAGDPMLAREWCRT